MAHFATSRAAHRWLLTLGPLLGLAGAAHAQSYNTGTTSNVGSLYHAGGFTNTATGSFANTGSSANAAYAGTGTAFANAGSYTATAGATDQFVGPAGAAGPQTLAGTTAPTFYNLALANGSGQVFSLTNTAGVDVANTLTLSNGQTTTTTTPAGAIRLGSAAPAVAGTLGATAGYVDGYVGKAGTTSFLYPLGASNQNATSADNPANGAVIYSPISLSSPGGTTLRYVATTAPSNTSFTPGDAQPLATVSSKEYYPMGLAGAPAGSTITMPYTNFGTSGTSYVGNPATLTIAAFNSSTGRWENLSSSATNSTGSGAVTVTLNKALSTTYTALALASTTASNPLPVTLTAFTATRRGADALLEWGTASELNSAYFEVQASLDGLAWRALGKVMAAGTSTASHRYAFTDPSLSHYGVPLLYYRLHQVDQDGTGTYSPVRTVAMGTEWQVAAYPNPSAGPLTLQLTTPEAGSVRLTLLDATGRTVLQRQFSAQAGTQTLPLEALPAGSYVLLVRQHDYLGTVRVVRE